MTKSPKNTSSIDLSVIILNHNSGTYLKRCLDSIAKSKVDKYKIEIIVVDNDSTDNSLLLSKKSVAKLNTRYLLLSENLGFSHGNNQGLTKANPNSKYVLFLNPDTVVEPNTFVKMINFFDKNSKVDAATCKVILAKTGQVQSECHRDFPTPTTALLHFSGLSSRRYFMEHLDYSQTQKIPACVGAFLMVKRSVGKKIGWWNEKYFFYGEDLDFCYKLKKNNFNLYYYPKTSVTHFQGISSGIIQHSQELSMATKRTKIKSILASTQAMRIFYQENLFSHYPLIIQKIVLLGIKLLEFQRLFKAKYL